MHADAQAYGNPALNAANTCSLLHSFLPEKMQSFIWSFAQGPRPVVFKRMVFLKNTKRPCLVFAMLLLCAGFCLPMTGQQQPASPGQPPLNAGEIVQNLVLMNLERARALQAYQSIRIYRLEYKGLGGSRTAEIVVNAKVQAPETKEFEIVSSTGSKLLIDRVFKKLLQSEKEAFEMENQKRIAINEENYEFTLIGFEAGPGKPCYVLSVKPRTKNKFLFHGRIWVDAEQFAVVRIQAEPAKNPSFWIKDTKIETLYMNVNDFWLPAHNHTISAVRLGGHADFTIEYKYYQITSAGQLNSPRNATAASRKSDRKSDPNDWQSPHY